MRAHAALTPADLGACDLTGRSAVVIDVFRASTTVVTAFVSGCRALIPVLTPEEARARAKGFPADEVLLGGERGGEPIPGFELGNSPLQCTPERVGGKVVIFTTTNGTRALVAASRAAATAVAGLVNLEAVAEWATAQESDLTLVCSGEAGAVSLEDTVCAGILLETLHRTMTPLELTDAARVCLIVAAHYRHRLERLLTESFWARELLRLGHRDDLSACLALNVYAEVPTLRDGIVRRSGPTANRSAPVLP